MAAVLSLGEGCLTRADRLAIYLQLEAGRRFEWGVVDCCLFGANWVEQEVGLDLAKAFRGRYASAMGAERFIREAGSLVELVESTISPGSAIIRTERPFVGDIGIVRAGEHDRPCVAIRAATRWMVKTEDGLAGLAGPALASWAI
jgi:hypothetical protein